MQSRKELDVESNWVNEAVKEGISAKTSKSANVKQKEAERIGPIKPKRKPSAPKSVSLQRENKGKT